MFSASAKNPAEGGSITDDGHRHAKKLLIKMIGERFPN